MILSFKIKAVLTAATRVSALLIAVLIAVSFVLGPDSAMGIDRPAKVEHPITAVCQTPDGKWLAAGDEGLYLFAARSLKRLRRIECQLEKIYAIKFSPGQQTVAVAGGTPAELGAVDIFSYPALKLLHHVECHEDIAADVAWVSDSMLVSGGMSGARAQIDLGGSDGSVDVKLAAVHSKGILAIEHLQEATLVSAGQDNAVRVWGLGPEKKGPKRRSLNNHTAPVNDLAVNLLGPERIPRLVASASDDFSIRFWQPAIGRMVRFVRLDSIPNCVIWDRPGKLAIAGCRNGKIVVIDSATAQITRSVDAALGWIDCLAISGDGKRLLVGGVGGMALVDLN